MTEVSAFLICCFFIGVFSAWRINMPLNSTYIKFKTFLLFYNINPERWEIDCSTVGFRTDFYCIFYKFHFIDFYRYLFWYQKQKRRNEKIKEIQKITTMIEVVKSDIAKFEAENQEKMQNAAKNIREITSRMKNT